MGVYEESADHGVLGHWVMSRDAEHVPDVRRRVRRVAEEYFGDDERAYEVGVCASETVSNAVHHGKGERIQVVVCADEDGMTVEVTDGGGSGSLPRQRSDSAESGRGLLIVSALADRWSYNVDCDTAELSVAFEFDAKRPAGAGRRTVAGRWARLRRRACARLGRPSWNSVAGALP